MTTLSKNHPDPGPVESWPTRIFSRVFSDTASIRNSSTYKDTNRVVDMNQSW